MEEAEDPLDEFRNISGETGLQLYLPDYPVDCLFLKPTSQIESDVINPSEDDKGFNFITVLC